LILPSQRSRDQSFELPDWLTPAELLRRLEQRAEEIQNGNRQLAYEAKQAETAETQVAELQAELEATKAELAARSASAPAKKVKKKKRKVKRKKIERAGPGLERGGKQGGQYFLGGPAAHRDSCAQTDGEASQDR
jgi:DNA-binding protein H-NS